MDHDGPPDWSWDPTLYRGSAAFYARGRESYPPDLAPALAAHLGLDGEGLLLDLGCGPGSLTLPLAPYVDRAVGVDADLDMLLEARRLARSAGVGNAHWVHARAESLPVPPSTARVVTLAQSFHWMEREVVAGGLRHVLAEDGAVAFVHATTHRGIEAADQLAHPQPPWGRIEALVSAYLGERRRAGQGVRTFDQGDEARRGALESGIFRAAGFTGPTRITVPGRTVDRDVERVVASVFSLSYAAPHLFGDRVRDFERDLRSLVDGAAADGLFSEHLREVAVDVWRP